MRRPVLQQNQRLSACVEQPRRGGAASRLPAVAMNPMTGASGFQLKGVQGSPLAWSRWVGIGEVSKTNYLEPLCLIEAHNCVATSGLQRLLNVAAANRRSHLLACQHGRRGSQAISGATSAGQHVPHGPGFSLRLQSSSAAWPNPSLKRSANGRPPGPVWRYAVHFRQPGPGVLPSSPA